MEECCRNGNAELLLQAVGLAEELHLPVHQNGDGGDTCLHIAAAIGHTECIQVLLDKGADCFVKNDKGNTSLHVAKGNHALRCLLSAGEMLNEEYIMLHGAHW